MHSKLTRRISAPLPASGQKDQTFSKQREEKKGRREGGGGTARRSNCVRSYVGNILLDVLFEFCGVGAVGSEDDPALERDDDLGLGGGVQFWEVEPLQLLLVDHDDVHALLELVDDAGLQVLVEGDEGLAGAAPGGVHVDDQQLGVLVRVVGEEVLGVADHRGQLQLLSLLSHLSYIIAKTLQGHSNYPPRNLASLPSQNPRFDINMTSVKYFAFCKSSGSLPVVGVTVDRSLEESLRTEIPKVIVKLKELQLKREERQRIKSDFGVWFCKKDQKDMYYLALCAPTYPERHIYAAVAQLTAHLAQLGDYETEPDATLKLHAKEKLAELAQKYDNIKSIDKLGEANRLLDGIKEDIADSTLKLMNNTVNLEGLERKTSDLKNNAMMFEQSATEVEREMWCKNCKMRILIVVVVVVLICVIVIPIATTVGKK